MSTARVGPKHQVTIPQDVFEELRLAVGDVLEAEVRDGRLILARRKMMKKAARAALTLHNQKLLYSRA